MFNTNGSNEIFHIDAECNCASCEQLCKPDMNGLPPSVLSIQNTPFPNNNFEEKSANKYRDNVISIKSAPRPSGATKKVQIQAVGSSSINFIYPMLECSWPE